MIGFLTVSAEQTVAEYKHSISNDKTLEGQVQPEMSRNLISTRVIYMFILHFRVFDRDRDIRGWGSLSPLLLKAGVNPPNTAG